MTQCTVLLGKYFTLAGVHFTLDRAIYLDNYLKTTIVKTTVQDIMI